MDKVWVLQIIFIIVEIFAAVPLTAAVFGDMDPGVITASAGAIWVGMIGSMICAVVRAVRESKKK